MERRHFLKIAFGFVAGAGLVTQGQAAPLLPTNPLDNHKLGNEPQPAVASQDDVDRLQPEQVRWGRRGWRRRRFWGYRRRHWGWRRRYRVRRRYWRRRRYW